MPRDHMCLFSLDSYRGCDYRGPLGGTGLFEDVLGIGRWPGVLAKGVQSSALGDFKESPSLAK